MRVRHDLTSRRVSEAGNVELLIEVATRFYLQGKKQSQIARDLSLDPSTVSRYLKRARREGIVQVEIRPPRRHYVELGRELALRFGIARAIVAPSGSDNDTPLSAVAAEMIESLLRSRMRLGVSWGRTLADVIRYLRPRTVSHMTIAQLSGGIDDVTPGIHGAELVRRLAELYPNSQVHYLHAPAMVESGIIRDALLRERSVEGALVAAARSELALVGIGALEDDATLIRGGHLRLEDRLLLVANGAIGSMNTRFFDAHGQPIRNLDGRIISITWEELSSIPTVVAVAAGGQKAEAIRGALRTGCADILVTDEETALTLVKGT